VKGYYKPTPVKWRVIGDSILIIGTTLTTVAGLLSLSPYVVATAAIITAIGKILTNFANK
jgi:membrane protein YqaA with SNARE-associated domain